MHLLQWFRQLLRYPSVPVQLQQVLCPYPAQPRSQDHGPYGLDLLLIQGHLLLKVPFPEDL